MEFLGKIIHISQMVGGVARSGKEWKKVEFVVETHDQYPKKSCFYSMDAAADNFVAHHKVGDEVKVMFDIDAHEYKGRWYNEVKAWSVSPASAVQPQPAPVQQAAPQPVPAQPMPEQPNYTQPSKEEELPF